MTARFASGICRSERGEESVAPGGTVTSALRTATSRLAAAEIEDAPFESEVLLSHALGITRTQLYARLTDELSEHERAAFDALLTRRMTHEPLAHITGHREFYGIDLLCTPAALIPRPETELLVELALDWIRRQPVAAPTIVDVGTGTGAIAIVIVIASHAAHAQVVATDTSDDALDLAAENARLAGVNDRVEFVQGSLLEPLGRPVDVIVANLPYIADDVYASLAAELHHEPESALRSGPRGTELIETLLAQARDALAPGGLLVAEHAWDQGESLRRVAASLFPSAQIETKRDLAGLERALVVRA